MTKAAVAGAGASPMNDGLVAEYLEAHPEFFERNPSLVQRLRVPDVRGSGTTVSLLEKQVDVLRERNRTLERKLAEFIEVARQNDQLAARIHRLTTRLVHARAGLNAEQNVVWAAVFLAHIVNVVRGKQLQVELLRPRHKRLVDGHQVGDAMLL